VTISRPRQLQLIVCGYAAVTLWAAAVYFARYLAALRDPAYSSGGMWAFGDLMLDVFVFFAFLVPTLFLLLYMAQSDKAFTKYSKIALSVSLLTPVCAVVLAVWQGIWHGMPVWWQDQLFTPLYWSPAVLVVLAMSRVIGRRQASKKLLNYALAIEGGTLVVILAIFIGLAGGHE
jgi:hypothetical protein